MSSTPQMMNGGRQEGSHWRGTVRRWELYPARGGECCLLLLTSLAIILKYFFFCKDGVNRSTEKLGAVKENPTGISRVGTHSFCCEI